MQRGDAKVILFEKIFYSTKDRMYGFIKKMLRDDVRVQDCMQQCYMKLWENLEKIDTTKEILPLLYTYSRNITIDSLRKNTRYVWMEDISSFSEQLTDDYSPHSWLSQKEAINELEALLSEMPVRRKQVFSLIKLDGFTYKEAAQQLNISISTVEKHMNEAYKYLSQEGSGVKLLICLLLLQN